MKFEVIEKPNDWTKEVKKNESANETQQQRYDYWVAFQDYAFQNAQFAKNSYIVTVEVDVINSLIPLKTSK